MPSLQPTQPAPGPVLLCVDLQEVFLKAIPDSQRLLRRCSFAIEAARGFGIPILFTEQVPQKLGATVPAVTALAPGAATCGKVSFSALGDHGIRDRLLESFQADHLIITGLETPICVYQTAVDALRAQIAVTLLSDCIGARRDEDARYALAALERAGVNVLPAETVFYSMLGDTGHPFFKDYTKLVKNYA